MSTAWCPRCGRALLGPGARCPEHGLAAVARPTPTDPFLGLVIADRYVVEAKLGAGGMGAVYRASQRSLGRDVAIKIVDPRASGGSADGVRRFLREANSLACISHPSVVSVYDFGEADDGWLWLAMELVPGRTLADLIREHPRGVDALRAASIAMELCAALEAVHGAGIVHRDLKPSNVMIVSDGGRDQVKMLDFGIARPLLDATRMTATGKLVGTPHYLAPEVLEGEVPGPESDLYALGIVLFELLSGAPPFDGSTAAAVMFAQVKELPPPLPEGVPTSVARVVMKLLEKDPARRPRSAATLSALLEGALEHAAGAGPSASGPTHLDAVSLTAEDAHGRSRTSSDEPSTRPSRSALGAVPPAVTVPVRGAAGRGTAARPLPDERAALRGLLATPVAAPADVAAPLELASSLVRAAAPTARGGDGSESATVGTPVVQRRSVESTRPGGSDTAGTQPAQPVRAPQAAPGFDWTPADAEGPTTLAAPGRVAPARTVLQDLTDTEPSTGESMAALHDTEAPARETPRSAAVALRLSGEVAPTRPSRTALHALQAGAVDAADTAVPTAAMAPVARPRVPASSPGARGNVAAMASAAVPQIPVDDLGMEASPRGAPEVRVLDGGGAIRGADARAAGDGRDARVPDGAPRADVTADPRLEPSSRASAAALIADLGVPPAAAPAAAVAFPPVGAVGPLAGAVGPGPVGAPPLATYRAPGLLAPSPRVTELPIAVAPPRRRSRAVVIVLFVALVLGTFAVVRWTAKREAASATPALVR